MFVVSSGPRDGTRYYDEWLKAGRLLSRVTQLTADNPRQRQPITELKALYRKRGEELARPANLATYKRQWAAFHAFDEESSTSTGTQMRRVLPRIGEEERERLSARRDHANSMTDWSHLLDSALAALGVVMIAAEGLLGRTAVRAAASGGGTERA